MPELAGKLYREGYDSLLLMKDVAVVGIQAVIAILINMLISLIHGLYYDPEKIESRDLYEVKTRKILMWSNAISSSSNVLLVAGMALAGGVDKATQFADIGGYIVTLHRLITDTKFILDVKREFLENKWEQLVVGKEYSFMNGGLIDELQ